MVSEATSQVDWSKSIRSILKSSDVREVKKLRKLVLLSLQMDDSDKSAKKQFKKTVQQLEEDGVLDLRSDGTIVVKEKEKKRKRDKEKKDKKKKKRKSDDDDEPNEKTKPSQDDEPNDNDESGETKTKAEPVDESEETKIKTEPVDPVDKNKPVKGNPQGVTRLFIGNLPFSVDESALGTFLPGNVTHIKWITDKETGKFYGSAFVEMDNSTSAAEAVAMAGEKLIGRPIKINFAPAREGDVWPPVKKVVSGGGQAGGSGIKAMSAKPDNCLKLFIGNLSYDIDDEGISKFFGTVEAEVKAVRWLHHKDSGDFKGCGYVEFWNTTACEKAATLNGKNLLGRPIRIDWTD
eukprot:Nitzschia sp. Nitz4//scaffold3_size479765//397452//398570//NITZ4_000170-RA/size479765-processed-gene-1.490-mRNA-1//1//CDS//3329550968//1649//frame0